MAKNSNELNWDTFVQPHADALSKSLWGMWEQTPVQFDEFVRSVEWYVGGRIAEDMYDYHDGWEREHPEVDE